jgi:hypothetical protein
MQGCVFKYLQRVRGGWKKLHIEELHDLYFSTTLLG